MWKVVTSSNLNPLLKLFFYSPILANNNLLLKIYCENIVVAFLNCDFLLFVLFFPSHHLSSILFFFSFLLVFSLAHTYPTTFLYLPSFSFSSSVRSISSAISLSFSSSLFFNFLFLLDSRTHSPSISHKQILSHTHTDCRQRSGDWCSTCLFVCLFCFFFVCLFFFFFFFGLISFILLFRFH